MSTPVILLLLLGVTHGHDISLTIRYPQFFHQSTLDSALEITEGKSSGSFIAFITLSNTNATDWSLNSTDEDFQVIPNGQSFSLVTTETLDRERKELYQFSVDARHLLPPYETLSKSVRIRLLDVNDCVPSFKTLIPLESSWTVQATDNDQPNTDNSRISYSLANYHDLFKINESTGKIEFTKKPQTDERYELIVLARDHGRPPLSSSTLVQIQSIKAKQWLSVDPKPEYLVILAAIFVFLTLLTCLICSIRYRRRRRRREESALAEKSSTPPTTIYDAIHIFPNTYYLPLSTAQLESRPKNNELSVHPLSCSSTSSPISGHDDGCYCSSDMSSDQFLLLNPSTLTRLGPEPCASYV